MYALGILTLKHAWCACVRVHRLRAPVRVVVCREIFARYCRFGDRLNVGPGARLKPTQFSRLCRDAIPVSPPGPAGFRMVDVDIVFKCVATQEEVLQRQERTNAERLATRILAAHGGVAPDGLPGTVAHHHDHHNPYTHTPFHAAVVCLLLHTQSLFCLHSLAGTPPSPLCFWSAWQRRTMTSPQRKPLGDRTPS